MTAVFRKLIGPLDIAIDLGTSKTSVFVRGEGLIYEEPSIICLRHGRSRNSVIAIGDQASRIRGKEPIGVKTIKPLQGGVIEHLEASKLMLQEVATRSKIRKPLRGWNVLIGAPYHISDIERHAVYEAATAFGSKSVHVVEEPIAAAIGADIDISECVANMIVDIGSGITEVAVLSLGGIVESESIRIGGDAISQALINYFRRHAQLIVGEQTVEAIKLTLGNVGGDSHRNLAVKGTDIYTRMPQTRWVKPADIFDAMLHPMNAIIATIQRVFESTPPMLAGDLMERGIVLTGGTAQLINFAPLIEKTLGVPVKIAKNPLDATWRGVGKMLDHVKALS